jgi:hypothetical protein
VVADVTTLFAPPSTIVENIRNTTGITAADFHIQFSQGDRVISTFNYNLTGANSSFVMDGPVVNGGFLMVGQMRESISIPENVVTIDAWWTDGNGNIITPEPTTMLLLSTGLVGVAIKMRKRLKSKSGQGNQ